MTQQWAVPSWGPPTSTCPSLGSPGTRCLSQLTCPRSLSREAWLPVTTCVCHSPCCPKTPRLRLSALPTEHPVTLPGPQAQPLQRGQRSPRSLASDGAGRVRPRSGKGRGRSPPCSPLSTRACGLTWTLAQGPPGPTHLAASATLDPASPTMAPCPHTVTGGTREAGAPVHLVTRPSICATGEWAWLGSPVRLSQPHWRALQRSNCRCPHPSSTHHGGARGCQLTGGVSPPTPSTPAPPPDCRDWDCTGAARSTAAAPAGPSRGSHGQPQGPQGRGAEGPHQLQ